MSLPASTPRRAGAGRVLFILTVAAGFSAGTARADDPPSRVGRIALIQGTVSFHPSPDAEWGEAVLNYPVAASTAIWVNEDSKADIEVGSAHVRLDAGTELDVTQLDDHTISLSVPQGRVDVTLRGSRQDERYDIETPRGDVVLTDGTYRIIAGTKDDPTQIAAFAGSGQLTAGTAVTTIPAGQEAASDTGDPPAYRLGPASTDEFDTWNTERDNKLFGQPTPPSVPQVAGTQALNAYGTWRQTPDYGNVWSPADVAPGWAPYTTGHWASVAPWGWTWIDDAPWGFAPFHYGRWVAIDGVWSWVPVMPGVQVAVEPVYAPALVAFIGDPAAIAVGFDGEAVGWVPLGPGELYSPWYGASYGYFNSVNVTNVNTTVINSVTVNNYRSYSHDGGFINQHHAVVVPAHAFAHGDPVGHAALHTNAAALDHPLHEATGGHGLPPNEAHGAGGLHPASAPPAGALHMAHPSPASAGVHGPAGGGFAGAGHPGAGAAAPHATAAAGAGLPHGGAGEGGHGGVAGGAGHGPAAEPPRAGTAAHAGAGLGAAGHPGAGGQPGHLAQGAGGQGMAAHAGAPAIGGGMAHPAAQGMPPHPAAAGGGQGFQPHAAPGGLGGGGGHPAAAAPRPAPAPAAHPGNNNKQGH